VLLGPCEIGELDLEHAVRGFLVVEQGAEGRTAVEARQAGPDDSAATIDERTVAAVADDGEIEATYQRSSRREVAGESCASDAASQASTPSTSEMPWRAAVSVY
jgi:hypothetical protein